MKKIFAIVLTVAMLLSVGAVVASAELPAGVQFHAGAYGVENAEDFSPAGDMTITWDPEASTKLNLADGDMADWADYSMYTIDLSNMVSWGGYTYDKAPEGWSISTYLVADSTWLYIGFFVVDPNFDYTQEGTYKKGDAFQICIDFGGRLGDMLETDPDNLPNKKNIFYSFGCVSDGAPLSIMREESDNDGWISEANGDGVKGAAKKTAQGWSAEFALSWEQLYNDYSTKSWDDPKIYVGSDEQLPLNIGCCLYYLDFESDGTLLWPGASTNGLTNDAGEPVVSFTAYDNGVNMILPYQDGMTFDCENIVVLPLTETTPEETTEAPDPETDPETAPETDPETAPETDPETAPETQAPGNETEPTAQGGCGSVIGFGAVAVLAAAAAAVALKKKD